MGGRHRLGLFVAFVMQSGRFQMVDQFTSCLFWSIATKVETLLLAAGQLTVALLEAHAWSLMQAKIYMHRAV